MMGNKKKDRLVLHVLHEIFLTREERYRLVAGETVETVGISVPVWAYRTLTSEPAAEVFCRYVLTNRPGQPDVTVFEEGYLINLPQVPIDYMPPERPTDDAWRKMTLEEQEQWYEQHETPKTAKGLRDLPDGGGRYLRFDVEKRMRMSSRTVMTSHVVELQDIQEIIETLAV